MLANEVYKIFQALKLHFNSKTYDFHKFKGQIKANLKSPHKDFWIYQKLAERPREELVTLILANLIINPKLYIRELLTHKAKEEWEFWKERVENKYDILLLQSKYIISHYDPSFFDHITIPETICKLYYNQTLSLESLVLLDHYFHFCDQETNHIIFEELKTKLIKYRPFISEDLTKITNIIEYLKSKYPPPI